MEDLNLYTRGIYTDEFVAYMVKLTDGEKKKKILVICDGIPEAYRIAIEYCSGLWVISIKELEVTSLTQILDFPDNEEKELP